MEPDRKLLAYVRTSTRVLFKAYDEGEVICVPICRDDGYWFSMWEDRKGAVINALFKSVSYVGSGTIAESDIVFV